MVHTSYALFKELMHHAPFVINDHRFGLVMKGTAKTNLNLIDHELKQGTIAYLAPGSIIDPLSVTEDFEIFGIALFDGFTMPFTPSTLPSAFNGQTKDFVLNVSENDRLTTELLLRTIEHLTRRPGYPSQVLASLVGALMGHFGHLYALSEERYRLNRSREQTVFDRFLELVNQHCAGHHQIRYYAERMCLTESYLSSAVKQASGMTAKDWIDRALVARIKVELVHHRNKSVVNIADELHFPNPSFFCKYFKRITGYSPRTFRLLANHGDFSGDEVKRF